MKNDQLTESERKLVVLLIRYMQKNPDAKHTAEGIARWWIMQQKFEEEVEVVKKIIEFLLEIDVLEEVILPEGNIYYKFHPENFSDNSKIQENKL